MVRYCPSCDRSVSNDARLCAYCGKMIPIHEAPIIAEQEPKKDKLVLIIVLVLVIAIVSTIAIAAIVYVYMGRMTGSSSVGDTPSVYFSPSYTYNVLTVMSTESNLEWDDFSFAGACNTSGLGTYVTFGDMITNCSGQIIISYEPTGGTMGTWTFS